MPARRDAPYFAVVCTDAELRRHVAVCEASDFYVVRDRALGLVRVHDRDAVVLDGVVLDAVEAAGAWLVRLHAAYYRHPFDCAPDGTAPPGVP